jgi:predicted tellurium resistance membrane protein TerC
VGVSIGILAMRLVAQAFVMLMGKYPFLETAAFIVIGILGLKLVLSLVEHYMPTHPLSHFLSSEVTEVGMTVLTILIFIVPIVYSMLTKHNKTVSA